MKIWRGILSVALMAALGMRAEAQTTVVPGLLSDRWQYPFNITPGTRTDGPCFLVPVDTTGEFEGLDFNMRDGMLVLQWAAPLPTQFQTAPYRVSRATIELWVSKNANFPLTGTTLDGFTRGIELYAAGFGPTRSELTWTGTESFIGSQGYRNGQGLVPARDPYPRDLATNEHVEDNMTTATLWARGIVPQEYVPGGMTDAFKVTFELDVEDPAIQAELKADFALGRTSWMVSGVYDAFDESNPDPHGGNEIFPRFVMSEGAGMAVYGTSAQAPRIVFELEEAFPQAGVDEAALSFVQGTGFEVNVVEGDAPTTRALVLRNTGDADLIVSGLSWTGPDAAEFSLVGAPTLPLVVAAGTSTTLTVRFAPAGSVERYGLEATLEIATNDPNAGLLSVAMTGDAVPVEVSRFEID